MSELFSLARRHRVLLTLTFIILLGAFLRLYRLTDFPPALYWDEVSLGYNAYSISETLHDEHGSFLPIIFQAYNDYKFPGYIYLTVPFVKFFTLSEWTTRLPSALAGTISVVLIFFLSKNLLKKFNNTQKYIPAVPLISSFVFAISPWSIQFSRAAFEANIALMFTLLGFVLLLTEKRKKFIFSLGLLSLLAALYTYRSEMVFVPLMLFSVLLIFAKDFFSKERRVVTIILLFAFALLAFPIYNVSLLGKASKRAGEVSIFKEATVRVGNASQTVIDNPYPQVGEIFLNYRLIYTNAFLTNYLPNIAPKFLFLEGDPNPRHGTSRMGALYLWQAAFIILGFIFLTKMNKKIGFFLVSWLLFAPVAAALASPTPHALRALNIVPAFSILTGMGIYLGYLYTKKHKFIYSFSIGAIIVFFFLKFLYLYFVITPPLTSARWGGGYEKLFKYVSQNEDKYEKILVTGEYWNPYMYFLFYKNYSPAQFQKNGSIRGFDKYIFGGTSWDTSRNSMTLHDINIRDFAETGSVMAILSPAEYELQKENVKKLHTISDISGKNIFIVTSLDK